MNNQEIEAIELQKKQQQDNRYSTNQQNGATTENREGENYFVEMNEKYSQKYPTADDALNGKAAAQSTLPGYLEKEKNNNDNDDGNVDVKKQTTIDGGIAIDVPVANALPFDMNIFLQRVFGIMFLGLLLTACVSLYLQYIQADVWLNAHPAVFIVLLIAELILVFSAAIFLRKLSFIEALAIFLLYAVLNGVTLTPIVAYYAASSVALAFFSSSAVFLSMALYGYFTKKDLDSWGPALFGALWGLIIAGLLNFFLGSSLMQFGICVIGVVVFAGMTAFDVQKLKQLGQELGNKATTDESSKIAVFGALNLYLDFINLFLYLLELLGNSKQ